MTILLVGLAVVALAVVYMVACFPASRSAR